MSTYCHNITVSLVSQKYKFVILQVRNRGDVVKVKVLGIMALIDEGNLKDACGGSVVA